MVEPALLEKFCCPACRSGALMQGESNDALCCGACGVCYHILAGVPVLLRPDNDVFSTEDCLRRAKSAITSRSLLARLVPSPSLNLARESTLEAMRGTLDGRGASVILVVGSGRQRSSLTPTMRASVPHVLIYTDVDCGADVDIFCDAHDLPFNDGTFDAVITTAVIEHVLFPERVAEEIGRVLKLEGLLYSELPFMQQVHEGPYDFTRYTLSGHRRLFRHFTELRSGMVAGPATALVWAIENFFLAFFSGQRARLFARTATRLLFSWMKHFDRLLVDRPQAMDGASCTFFFGSKSGSPVSSAEIIRRYVGAKHLRHI